MYKLVVFYYFLILVSADGFAKRNKASSSLISATMELCGSDSRIDLTKSGPTSSMAVTLSPLEHNGFCTLRVTAPKTHIVKMQFIETDPELHQALMTNNTTEEAGKPCVMSLFLPENLRIPVWKGDPCSRNALADVDLLPSDFKIMWSPPSNPTLTRGRKFVLTAVGQGSVCKEPGQHTCMRIGWDPMMCVSDSLLCNGVVNCPKSSTTGDEDETLCKKNLYVAASLEQIAAEFFKKWKPPDLSNNNKWLHGKLEAHGSTFQSTTKRSFWREWQELKKTESTTTEKPVMQPKPKAADSISQVLSKYGPWGYLMLGMLICGTVLMFCGLWECCFRKPKVQIDPPSSQTPPTTVLIINPQEEAATSPPNYDELDQPPSYTTLFPNLKQLNQCFRNSNSHNNSDAQSTNSCTNSSDSSNNSRIDDNNVDET